MSAVATKARPSAPDLRTRLEDDLKQGRLVQFFADVEDAQLTDEEVQTLLKKHIREDFIVRLARLIRG